MRVFCTWLLLLQLQSSFAQPSPAATLRDLIALARTDFRSIRDTIKYLPSQDTTFHTNYAVDGTTGPYIVVAGPSEEAPVGGTYYAAIVATRASSGEAKRQFDGWKKRITSTLGKDAQVETGRQAVAGISVEWCKQSNDGVVISLFRQPEYQGAGYRVWFTIERAR